MVNFPIEPSIRISLSQGPNGLHGGACIACRVQCCCRHRGVCVCVRLWGMHSSVSSISATSSDFDAVSVSVSPRRCASGSALLITSSALHAVSACSWGQRSSRTWSPQLKATLLLHIYLDCSVTKSLTPALHAVRACSWVQRPFHTCSWWTALATCWTSVAGWAPGPLPKCSRSGSRGCSRQGAAVFGTCSA